MEIKFQKKWILCVVLMDLQEIWGSGEGQENGHGGAEVEYRIDFKDAVVIFDDTFGYGESEAGTFTGWACGEEWVKDFRLYCSGDAGTIIANSYEPAVLILFSENVNVSSFSDSLNRISNDVQKHLVDFCVLTIGRGAMTEMKLNGDSVTQASGKLIGIADGGMSILKPKQISDRLQHFAQIEVSQLS